MQAFSIFVPAGADQLDQIQELFGGKLARGSAIVASGRRHGETVEVVVSPPRFPQESFADVAKRAVREGRRAQVPADLVVEVGFIDMHEGEVRLLGRTGRLLDSYLGRRVYRNDLEASDSRQRQRQDARMDARRARISGNLAKEMEIRSRHNVWNW